MDGLLNCNSNILKSNKWLNVTAVKATNCSNNNVISFLHQTRNMNFDVSKILMGLYVVDNIKICAITTKILVSDLRILFFLTAYNYCGLLYYETGYNKKSNMNFMLQIIWRAKPMKVPPI